ncbi:hypothetical protein [Janibacter melonis]|uniref:hypothetical protein n=2 Tax=Janibacter melonis TaxID=262209 RepID=UPI001E3B04DC|nr:hypothetical protein [Janibacter melonis]MCB5992328.1 hypothetical protein [Janibacter melonis]
MPMRTGLALLLAAAVTSACGGSSPSHGDDIVLTGESDAGELCLPGSTEPQDMSFGMETVTVAGTEPVELVAVNLVDAEGLDLVQAYVAPEPVRGDFGGLTGWPGHAVSKRTQEALLPVPGAVVLPAADVREGEKQPGLVLHLRGADGARFEGLTVDYRVEGSADVLRTDRSYLRFAVGTACTG